MPPSKEPGGSRREEAPASSASAAQPQKQSVLTSATKDAPHPLAVKRTELVWEGKYDAAGQRVPPVRVTLPFRACEID